MTLPTDQITQPPPNSPALIDRLRTAWRADLKAADLAEDTIRKYSEALGYFFKWLNQNELPIREAARRDIADFRDEQLERYSRSAVTIRLAAIRRFYDFLMEKDTIHHNPAGRVLLRGKGRKARKREELTDSEMRVLLDGCEVRHRESAEVCERDRAILYLMAYCGLRTIEVHRIDREDLQTREGRIVCWVQQKGHKEHDNYVVLPIPAEDALRNWMQVHPNNGQGPIFVSLSKKSYGRRLSCNYIRRMVRRRLDQAGILQSTKTTHSIRHSAITRAMRGGASLLHVMKMVGHKKPETTLGYYHEDQRLKNPPEDRIRYDPPD